MKKTTLAILLLGSIIANACPPPTHHGVLRVGVNYDYAFKEWNKNNISIYSTLGWEESHRFLTVSTTGSYAPMTKNWSVGGEISINPIGIIYGTDTPVNVNIISGAGYKSIYGAYFATGLELSGRVGLYVTPFARCTYDINFGPNKDNSINMCAGIRFWLGKDW